MGKDPFRFKVLFASSSLPFDQRLSVFIDVFFGVSYLLKVFNVSLITKYMISM